MRPKRPKRPACTCGALLAALFAVACSAFNPDVGPLRDSGTGSCATPPPVTGSSGGYGGYGVIVSEVSDAGATCGDAS